MHRNDPFHLEGFVGGSLFDSELHRIDVGQDLPCRCPSPLSSIGTRFGAGQVPSVDLETFNLGGCDRLGPQQ